MKLTPAYIALGSNLDDPLRQIEGGIEELAMLPDTRLGAVSSLYRTAPVGFDDQPDFINAVAMIETELGARALLDELLAIEKRYARVRGMKNGPRTLDLDIVLYGDTAQSGEALTIPHPRMHERAFVLVPLAEIAPDAVVPGLGKVRELAARVDASGVTRIEQEQQ
ncbi:MAG TPA: 2-amino-4-hydroxy-6-hydroxymethyldihydropteridine diphosphokinase [Burkholderiales bacterium]|nr:2-amino-4-hydroxy-6-hydroxymethyldihydropteridine diphosphokinase [Burkholderiales bacterium]